MIPLSSFSRASSHHMIKNGSIATGMRHFSKKVQELVINDVTARDGWQGRKPFIRTPIKVGFIDLMTRANFKELEPTSLVNKKFIPQMSDAEEVLNNIQRSPKTKYWVLVPNMHYLNIAIAHKVKDIAVFGSVTEGYSKANINCTVEQSFQRFQPVIAKALENKMTVRGYVSCCLGCPVDGEVSPEQVADTLLRYKKLGCHQIVISDTIGIGTPKKVQKLLSHVLPLIPAEQLAIHFHGKGQQVIDNVEAAIEMGIFTVDSSINGVGGSPTAKYADGNVSTEAVLALAQKKGLKTGIDMAAFEKARRFLFAYVPQSGICI